MLCELFAIILLMRKKIQDVAFLFPDQTVKNFINLLDQT